VSYTNTFIRVADDCPTATGESPPARAKPSVAELQHRLLCAHPYELTEELLHVRVHGLRAGLDERETSERYDALHAEVYSKPQACLRASPLTKRYGFGAHYDGEGRIALHPREGDSYARLAHDPALKQLPAMRSTRG
jgi:hypothetical protein